MFTYKFVNKAYKTLSLHRQVGFMKHLGEVATVLLDLVCQFVLFFLMSFQTDSMINE